MQQLKKIVLRRLLSSYSLNQTIKIQQKNFIDLPKGSGQTQMIRVRTNLLKVKKTHKLTFTETLYQNVITNVRQLGFAHCNNGILNYRNRMQLKMYLSMCNVKCLQFAQKVMKIIITSPIFKQNILQVAIEEKRRNLLVCTSNITYKKYRNYK